MTKSEQKMETRQKVKVKLSSLERLIAQRVVLKEVSNRKRFHEKDGLYIQNLTTVFLNFKKIFGEDY